MTHSYGPGGLTTQEQGNNPALIGMVPAATSSRVVGRLVDSAIGILVIVVIPYAVSLGGLALFLYGMNAMGDGLAKVSGGKLEKGSSGQVRHRTVSL